MDGPSPPDRPVQTDPSKGSSSGKKKRKKKKEQSDNPVAAPPTDMPGRLSLSQRQKVVLEKQLHAGKKLPAKMETKIELRTRAPARTLEESDDYYKTSLRQGLTLLKSPDRLPEAHYLLATSYYGMGKYKLAVQNARELLAKLPEDHYLRTSAFIIMGRSQLSLQRRFDEFIVSCFQKAWEADHPDAAKYLVLARSGLLGSISLLKWCNPEEGVRILEQYKDKKCRFEDKQAKMRTQTRSLSDDDPMKQVCLQMLATEGRNVADAAPIALTYFTGGLCDYMDEGATEHSTSKIEPYLKTQDPQSTAAVIYLYVQYLKTGNPKVRTRLLSEIEKSPQPTARLFCARAMAAMDPVKHHDAIVAHLDNIYCKMTIQGYENLCEFYIARQQPERAIEQLTEGEAHLQAFLDKKRPLYAHVLGQQSKHSFTDGKQGEAQELEFEELAAVSRHLDHWHTKKALLLDTFKPPSPTQVDKELLESQSDSTTDTSTASGSNSDDESSDESTPTPQTPDSTQTTRDTSEKEDVTATSDKPVLSPSAMQRQINEAMNLIHYQAEFDQARELLSELQPPKHTVIWYRLQQAKAWLLLESSSHYDYLSSKLEPGETTAQRGKRYLKLAEKKVRHLLHKIESDISKSLPESEQLSSAASFSQSIDEAIQYAQHLRSQGHEALLRQYGGLFSMLGHIHKAYRDNPLTRPDHDISVGIHYYKIANRIRGRAL
ncbi:tetratricopeptide repeat protein [Endozoicomonas arenosclerae]|uniref:tetratricopeptide repeat protein n=1 Tax=Endozoicomonas arenosclerae TaxID=1633495 RepID=UPI000781FBC5|nr:hypothetical protein [Endozoicomonas arenosclerae]